MEIHILNLMKTDGEKKQHRNDKIIQSVFENSAKLTKHMMFQILQRKSDECI